MRKNEPQTVTLTAYLLKPAYCTADSALRLPAGRNIAHDTIPSIGDLYTQESHPHAPKWTAFFGALLPPSRNLINSSASGVLFVDRDSRLFAVTFGYGKSLLQPGAWEEGFGLRVTLNSIDAAKLKSIDHKAFEAVTRHTRTQTSREGSTSDFGLDVERDLVRAVTGQPRDASLGKRLTGMDALVFTAKLELAGLPNLLGLYLARHSAQDYKLNFGWIDNIGEIRDPSLVSTLDKRLVARVRAGTFDRLWLSIPEIVDWSRIGGFKYQLDEKKLLPDLHVKDFVESVKDPATITEEVLRKRRAFVMDADGEKTVDEWPIYGCIYCEEDYGNETYLLTGGKWYRVERNFVADVNNTVSKLVSTVPALPAYGSKDVDEEAYNARITGLSSGNLALLDRRMAPHGGGHSKFEFCDLYSSTKEIIHVKRYGGSSAPLSHLFSQGLNSAQLWLGDAAFRKKVNSFLPRSHKLQDSQKKPDPAEFRIVFAVVSRSAKAIDQSLPFFSRMALRNAARQLDMLGFPVALVKIVQS